MFLLNFNLILFGLMIFFILFFCFIYYLVMKNQNFIKNKFKILYENNFIFMLMLILITFFLFFLSLYCFIYYLLFWDVIFLNKNNNDLVYIIFNLFLLNSLLDNLIYFELIVILFFGLNIYWFYLIFIYKEINFYIYNLIIYILIFLLLVLIFLVFYKYKIEIAYAMFNFNTKKGFSDIDVQSLLNLKIYISFESIENKDLIVKGTSDLLKFSSDNNEFIFCYKTKNDLWNLELIKNLNMSYFKKYNVISSIENFSQVIELNDIKCKCIIGKLYYK